MTRSRFVALALVSAVLATACASSNSAVGPSTTGKATTSTATKAKPGELLSHVARAPDTPDDAVAGASAIDAFGRDLLRANVGLGKGNLVLSPWSIAVALAMTRAGAKGTTAAEMAKVLHIGDPASIDQALNSLDQALARRNATFPGREVTTDTVSVEIDAANRVYAQAGLGIEQAFLDQLARSYGAGLGVVDFAAATERSRRTINAWVATKTKDRIPELLAPGVVDASTAMVLVNAIYLKADWSAPFDTSLTTSGAFHAPSGDVQAALMHHNTEDWPYASGDGWQSVSIPYAGQQLAMTIVLPDPGRFDDVANRVTTGTIDPFTTKAAAVNVTLPRFDIESHLSLAAQLSTLGMPTAFSSGADFTGISRSVPLQISDVIHQANITVNERGTVAAAATAVVIEAAASMNVKDVTVDRPFLFFVRDQATGLILFAGQVTNPAPN